ncbi:MAG: two-component regulator propeller domain-containing protein, partial [Cyanobacteria bacterium P01_E01_bin.45]
FTGERWVVRDVDQPAGVTGFAIDARDSEWIGSEEEGAWVYSRGGAVVQDRDSSNLSSNQVLAIATDASGRTWLGTSWGLNVFDGREWIAYHMNTADLPDNRIVAIAVAGEGPRLPEPLAPLPGALVGTLVQAGEPFADTLVEVCVDTLDEMRRGPSPCANQLEFYAAITDIDGQFTFSALPTGRYRLAFLKNGEWTQIEAGLSDDPLSRVLVTPGNITNIGSLDIIP